MSTQLVSSETFHPYVECRLAVHGGRPVLKGRRFPVSSIVQNHRRGLSVDEILPITITALRSSARSPS